MCVCVAGAVLSTLKSAGCLTDPERPGWGGILSGGGALVGSTLGYVGVGSGAFHREGAGMEDKALSFWGLRGGDGSWMAVRFWTVCVM